MMTDKDLKLIIDKLNRNENNGLLQLRPLTKTIDFVKSWKEEPKPSDNIVGNTEPSKFYLVKNFEGVYVAIVLDMRGDLHWFVDNKYRRQGHLTKAMRETILFHLFQDDREEQIITIDENRVGKRNRKASENVAFSLGFVKNNNGHYILKKENWQTENYINGKNTEISNERLQELRKKINYLAISLWQVHTEVEMKLGNTEYAENLKWLVDELKKHTWKLEDAVWESREKVV